MDRVAADWGLWIVAYCVIGFIAAIGGVYRLLAVRDAGTLGTLSVAATIGALWPLWPVAELAAFVFRSIGRARDP